MWIHTNFKCIVLCLEQLVSLLPQVGKQIGGWELLKTHENKVLQPASQPDDHYPCGSAHVASGFQSCLWLPSLQLWLERLPAAIRAITSKREIS